MRRENRLVRFARKPQSEKWAAVRATLGNAVRVGTSLGVNKSTLQEIQAIRAAQERTAIASERAAIIAKERYVDDAMSKQPYSHPKRLESYGFKVYSQFDEDGIIEEIFRRIGITSRTFVEFGVGNGLENNTLKLLLEGWRGLWLDGNENFAKALRSKFADLIASGTLAFGQNFITSANINDLIGSWRQGEIDLLSIDIDGNDFHIWRALKVVNPRVVVVEYNAKFPPPLSICQEYNPTNIWRGTDYMGASLEALARLGSDLGYYLVGTNFVGLNAFFVRKDLVGDLFQSPFTAKNHYNRAKYFLWQLYVSGHSPDWGPYMEVSEPLSLVAFGPELRSTAADSRP